MYVIPYYNLYFYKKKVMNFIDELKWRGMINDITPGLEKKLELGVNSAYVGFDPTASSLHIGNLAPVMLLTHFQNCGHKGSTNRQRLIARARTREENKC